MAHTARNIRRASGDDVTSQNSANAAAKGVAEMMYARRNQANV
jgi:hypothetical protein